MQQINTEVELERRLQIAGLNQQQQQQYTTNTRTVGVGLLDNFGSIISKSFNFNVIVI